MKNILWLWLLLLFFSQTAWIPEAAAQAAEDVSGATFMLEIAAGGLSAVAGAMAGELARIGWVQDLGGVLGAAASVGVLSLAASGPRQLDWKRGW